MLERFLAAQTWEEGLPWLTPIDTTARALTLPWPPHQVNAAYQVANRKGQTTDRFFNVDFKELGTLCMLVRGQEGATPKVFAEPLLDLHGGRLASFAANPSTKEVSFHVFASALPRCTNPSVPSPDGKISVRLLASDAGKPLATAYAAKQSPLAKLLDSAAADIRYGQPAACVAVLRWNLSEDAKRPFLEVIELKEFGWTP